MIRLAQIAASDWPTWSRRIETEFHKDPHAQPVLRTLGDVWWIMRTWALDRYGLVVDEVGAPPAPDPCNPDDSFDRWEQDMCSVERVTTVEGLNRWLRTGETPRQAQMADARRAADEARSRQVGS